MKPTASRLYRPRPCEVEIDNDGAPARVDGVAVEVIREEWLVEDGWWTEKPLGRHYFELVLSDGRDIVIFSDTHSNWLRQRA